MSQKIIEADYVNELYDVTLAFYKDTDFGKAFIKVYDILSGMAMPYELELTLPDEAGQFKKRKTRAPYPLQLKLGMNELMESIEKEKKKIGEPKTELAKSLYTETREILDKYLKFVDEYVPLVDHLLKIYEHRIKTAKEQQLKQYSETVLKSLDEQLEAIEKARVAQKKPN
ncbi:MAG: hypothetical protein QMD12_03330 [Candidatus Aenigmarchaeota archaeon]|nr:hypothetical protein [Candidatus Aenigmarchaeota archaeon]